MRPGDLVEFKAGTFGIEHPRNVGIYLDRVKRKGEFFVVLYTEKGRKEFKRDRLGKVLLSGRLPDDVAADDGALAQRLATLVAEARAGTAEDVRRAAEGAKDRDLWRRLDGSGTPLTVRDLAIRFFDVADPRGHHIDAVRDLLKPCTANGVGYFERLPGREEQWKPLSADEHRAITAAREGLNALRNRLVKTEEVEDEDGRLRTVHTGIPVADAGLGQPERERLAFVRDAMAAFVLHDRLPDGFGVAGTGVRVIDGWHLLDFLRFLAADWTGSRGTTSSNFVEFLVGTGLWTPSDAIRAIAKRKVLGSGGFEWEMDDRAEREAGRFPSEFPPEWLEGREDHRDRTCFTIDPPDAKDYDDAVGVQRLDDGGWLLTVHIADVSHYVGPGASLDLMARRRATSLYLPTGVLPMLPPRLSDDLCSLKAGVDRLALSCDIEYDATGQIRAERFFETVIRVRENRRYPDVDAAIERGEEPFASMNELALLLRSARRGLALETGEVRVKLDAETVAHHVKFGTDATRMIEAFMVAANEAVARVLRDAGVATMYRCHALPDRAGVERFNAQMKVMELPIEIALPERKGEGEEEEGAAAGASVLDLLKRGGSLTLVSGGFLDDEGEGEGEGVADASAAPVLKGLAQLPEEERDAWLKPFRDALGLVNAMKDPDLRDVVYVKLLSCMGRAVYTPDNLGHFGLGSECYCHFTSPIRRYPDLLVHRQLRAHLRGEAPPHDREEFAEFAPHTSDQGALADDLERGIVAVALLFEERAADRPWPRPGLVNGITRGGVFVSLGHGLEARVGTSDIPGGPWSVDDHDSHLFAGSRDRPEMLEDLDASAWRDLVDPGTGEMVRVRVRLGDRIMVTRAGFDYVDGKVAAKLAE